MSDLYSGRVDATAERPDSAPAYSRVAAQLRTMILSGEVAPGQRLPVEADLAERFSVSRSTVREALRVLMSEHLVATTRGVTGGTFVSHPQADAIAGTLAAGIDFLTTASDLTAAELLEAREALEVPAARFAAIRRTSRDLRAMALALPEDADVDRLHRFEGNRSFHDAVMKASGNRILSVLAGPLYSVLRERFLRDRPPRSFWQEVMEDHHRIYDAIASGDPAAAEATMAAHFERTRIAYTDPAADA
jgi:DNA-binding FadR family transcriptional regulator